MRTAEQKHLDLYAKIPEFECKDGCFDCCGPVPFSGWEWERIEGKRKGINIDCPYAVKGWCDIYEQRPLICRLYGTIRRLKCPHGCKPEAFLSKKVELKIIETYYKLMRG